MPGQPPSESKQTLGKLLQRMNECQRGTEVTLASCRDSSDKAIKKAEARRLVEAMEAVFDKYDADKDGFLSKPEVKKYAKGAFNLTLANTTMDSIMKVVAEDGSKGVRKDHFQKLKVAIGIEREKMKDAKRKEARVAREKELATLKGKLQDRVTETEKKVSSAAELVDKAETQATPLPTKGKSMVSGDMLQLADEVAEAIKEAKEESTTLKKEVADIAEGVDIDLKAWLAAEVKKLEDQLSVFEPKLARAAHLATKFREEARIKEAEELYILEKQALATLKNHKRVRKMTSETLFAEVDTKSDGQIDESEFVAFFEKCEKLPKKAKNGEEATDEPEEKELDKEDLAKVFEGLDDEGEGGAISKEKFTNIVRTFMKVSRDTVITADVNIKDSKTLRRLDVGELVEVLEGPVKEPTVDVWRVRTQVLRDGLQGWITMSGNQGSVFLEEGGDTFKVVKDTIMTESFELDGGSSKDATRKLKDTTRKLKEGEIVEVREWARKEEKSGLMRMKCKAKSDGVTGWVTTVGNQGTVFLEVV